VTLGAAVPLAFWVDSATYLASATLLTTLIVAARSSDGAADQQERQGLLKELQAGWQFLRSEATLLANTIQAAIGQFTIGITIALVPIYAHAVYSDSGFGWQAVWGFLETG